MKKHELTIKPTNACNMRCRHCYHFGTNYDDLRISADKVKKMMNIWAQDCDVFEVLWHGGEPTLMGLGFYEEMFEFEEQLKQKLGINIVNIIQTNGVLIDDSWCQLFKYYNVSVGVSFDGPHNDLLRMNTERVYNNISLLRKHDIKNYSCLCVVTKETIDKLVDIYEWFRRNEINYKIIAISKDGLPPDISDLVVDKESYANNLVKGFKRWLFDVDCPIVVSTFLNMALRHLNFVRGVLPKSCSCLHTRVGMDSRGNIFPCGKFYDSKYKIADIDSIDSIDDVLRSPVRNRLLNKIDFHMQNCRKNCKYFPLCYGGCIVAKLSENTLGKVYTDSCCKLSGLFDDIRPMILKLVEDYKHNNVGGYNQKLINTIRQRRLA